MKKKVNVIVYNTIEFIAARALLDAKFEKADWDTFEYNTIYPRSVYVDCEDNDVHTTPTTAEHTMDIHDLIEWAKDGYPDEEPEVMTLAQVCKELGRDIVIEK